jgi:hypothetical protein
VWPALFDEGSVLPLRTGFGIGMHTALARIEGRPVGVIANNPLHLSGAIDAEAADKGARFLQLCDAHGLPVVSLIDTPGFMVGPDIEAQAQVRHVSRMFVAAAHLRVPFMSVVLRKGYGLGALVDILSGVLSGANFGPWVPPFVAFLPVLPDLPGKGIGHFLGAMDVDGFIETKAFKQRMDQWIRRFKNATPVNPDQPVIIHGGPEAQLYKHRLESGIPLIDKVCKDLTELATSYSLDHPF